MKERNLVTAILLSVVTCGIYGIYWSYCAAKEAVAVKDPTDGTLEAVLAIFFPFLGFFLAEKKFAEGCAEKEIEHTDRSLIYLLIGLLVPYVGWLIDLAILQNDLNKLA